MDSFRVQGAFWQAIMLAFLLMLLDVDRAEADPIDPPFEIIEFPPLEVPAGLACDEVRNEKNAFAAYEAVRRELSEGVPLGDVAYLDCFLPEASLRNDSAAVLESFVSSVFDANVLYGYLERRFEARLQSAVRSGKRRQGGLAWRGSHLGLAALYAFEATNDRRFFDLYKSFFDRSVMIRDDALGWKDDYHGRVMKAWGASNFRGNDEVSDPWVAHITHFGVMMIPATGFARLALSRPDLADERQWGREVIDYFEMAYRQFEGDLRAVPGTDERWYWRPYQERFEPTNHVHVLGRSLLNVAAVSDDPLYDQRISWILEAFEEGVSIDDRGFASWNYSPWFEPVEVRNRFPNSRLLSARTRKSAISVPFLYEAVDEGYPINPRVLDSVTMTIRDWVIADNTYKLHTHPKDSRAVEIEDRKKRLASVASIAGFQAAESIDPEIGEVIRMIVSSRPDLYAGGWLEHPWLTCSYARFLDRTVPDSD